MRRLPTPSPATAIALVALFIALGGAGYAASDPGAHSAKHKPLTARTVNKLIGSYFKKHRKQLVGPQGSQGTQGAQGQAGATGIPPTQTMEFSADSANAGTSDGLGCVELTSSSTTLDLPLPAGAQITQVRARYFDTSPDKTMQFGLEVVTPAPAHTIVAGGGSTDSSTITVTPLTSGPADVLPPVSDTTNYYIFANPGGSPATGKLAFCGAAVDYKLAS